MGISSPSVLEYTSPQLNAATFNATFPAGTYSYTASGPNPTETVSVDYSADSFPSAVPYITNFNSLQGIDASAPFTVTWNPFSGALSGTNTALVRRRR